jgi:hypothetical protein
MGFSFCHCHSILKSCKDLRIVIFGTLDYKMELQLQFKEGYSLKSDNAWMLTGII